MLFLDAGQFGKWYTRAVDIVTAADNKCSIPDLTNFLTTQNMHLVRFGYGRGVRLEGSHFR